MFIRTVVDSSKKSGDLKIWRKIGDIKNCMIIVGLKFTVLVVFYSLFSAFINLYVVGMSSKALLRTQIKRKLKEISSGDITLQSASLTSHINSIPNFQEVRSVSIYLSMGGEVNTYGLIKDLMETHGKQVYIPKVTGKESKDMIMIPLSSYADID